MKILLISCILLLNTYVASASECIEKGICTDEESLGTVIGTEIINWNKLIPCMIQTESSGNPNAYNKKCGCYGRKHNGEQATITNTCQ